MTDESAESICRTCLLEAEDLRSLFRAGKICGEVTTLSDMLQELTPLKIKEDDLLPPHICGKCVLSLSKAFMFRRTCINSDVILHDRIKPGETASGEEDGVLDGTLYFYDDTEAENSVEDGCGDEQVQYEVHEEIQLKQEEHSRTCDLTTSAGEEEIEEAETLEEESYDQAEEESYDQGKFSVSQYDDGDEKREAPTLYTVVQRAVTRKKTKRSKQLPGPPFKCEICFKVLSNHSSFKYHMQLHSDKTPFLCTTCGQGFKTRNAYDGHMTTHNENNPNKCNVCGKVYRQAGSLRSHLLTHTGEKPFLCLICGKGMTQKSGFKKHMLTHTGEKPHTCDICGNSFRFSSNLITHRRRHTGEKPYVCTTCGKAFVGGEQLKRHSTVHSGDKFFECDLCNRVFNRKSSLKLHRQLHSAEKKYGCDICGKTYVLMKSLQQHILTHKEDFKPMSEEQPEQEEELENSEEIGEIEDEQEDVIEEGTNKVKVEA